MSETLQSVTDTTTNGADDSKQVNYGDGVCKCGQPRGADEIFCIACGDGNKIVWRKKLLLNALEALDKPRSVAPSQSEGSVLAEIDYDESQLEEWKESARVRLDANARMETARSQLASAAAKEKEAVSRGGAEFAEVKETRERKQADLDTATQERKTVFDKAKATPEEIEMLRQRVARANLDVKEKAKAKVQAQRVLQTKSEALALAKHQQMKKEKHEAALRAYNAVTNSSSFSSSASSTISTTNTSASSASSASASSASSSNLNGPNKHAGTKKKPPTNPSGWECIQCSAPNPAWKLGCFSCQASKSNPDSTWMCVNCGVTANPSDNHCSRCNSAKNPCTPGSGTSTPTPVSEAESRLQAAPKCSCGWIWSAGEQFCGVCGRPQAKAAKPSEVSSSNSVKPVPNAGPALKGKGWICNCGAFYLREDTCKKCGSTRAAVLESAAKRKLEQDPVSEAERLLRESAEAEKAAEQAAARAREQLVAAERRKAAAADAKRAAAGPGFNANSIDRKNHQGGNNFSKMNNTSRALSSPLAPISSTSHPRLTILPQINARSNTLDIRNLRDVRSKLPATKQPGLLDHPSQITFQDSRNSRPHTPPRSNTISQYSSSQYSSHTSNPYSESPYGSSDYNRGSPKKRPLSPHRNSSPPRGRAPPANQTGFSSIYNQASYHDLSRSGVTRDNYSLQQSQQQSTQQEPRPQTPPRSMNANHQGNDSQWRREVEANKSAPEPSYWEDECSSNNSLPPMPGASETKPPAAPWTDNSQSRYQQQPPMQQDSRGSYSSYQSNSYPPSRNHW